MRVISYIKERGIERLHYSNFSEYLHQHIVVPPISLLLIELLLSGEDGGG
jgi:hypothetical protein